MTVLKQSSNLLKGLNDRARKVTIRGKQAIVPLKFDADGNPATQDRLIFKRLSLNDLRFLQVWRDASWDIEKARQQTQIDEHKVEVLVRKLACFREEDARVKALCQIPTPQWISAAHVQNIYEGGALDDSSHKSLQELAKIEGAYKQTVVSQTNIFNMPQLTPEEEAALKAVGDRLAMQKNAIPAEISNAA